MHQPLGEITASPRFFLLFSSSKHRRLVRIYHKRPSISINPHFCLPCNFLANQRPVLAGNTWHFNRLWEWNATAHSYLGPLPNRHTTVGHAGPTGPMWCVLPAWLGCTWIVRKTRKPRVLPAGDGGNWWGINRNQLPPLTPRVITAWQMGPPATKLRRYM